MQGRVIFGSGRPLDPVKLSGKTYTPGQVDVYSEFDILGWRCEI